MSRGNAAEAGDIGLLSFEKVTGGDAGHTELELNRGAGDAFRGECRTGDVDDILLTLLAQVAQVIANFEFDQVLGTHQASQGSLIVEE